MATHTKAKAPHTFDERWYNLVIKAVRQVLGMPIGSDTHRRRWPVGDESPSNKFGNLATQLNSCSLTPAMVNEYTLSFNSDGTVVTGRVPVLNSQGQQVQFKAIDHHGVTLPAGRWVSCIHDSGDVWAVVAAHCTGTCTSVGTGGGGTSPPPTSPPASPPPPTSPESEPQPEPSPNPDEPPPPPPPSDPLGDPIPSEPLPMPPDPGTEPAPPPSSNDCLGAPPYCPPPGIVMCVSGMWTCTYPTGGGDTSDGIKSGGGGTPTGGGGSIF